MKTIVLTSIPEMDKFNIYGYDRIELIPGFPDFAYMDGELEYMDKDMIGGASMMPGETQETTEMDICYIITYEESKWIN